MGGIRTRLALCASTVALASAQGVLAQGDASRVAVGDERSSASQSQSSLAFTVPLVSASRAFGDVLIRIERNGLIAVEGASLRRQLADVLNDTGLLNFDRVIDGREVVQIEELRSSGIELEFDQSALELKILAIDPIYLKVQKLGASAPEGDEIDLRVISPAEFSTYLNIAGNVEYDTRLGSSNPDIFLDGATRVGGVVVEYDGAFTDQFGSDYRFLRRSTRVVYDDPKSYRRYTGGDLYLNSLSLMRNPQIGGIALEKSRQIFDPFRSVTQLAGRQIFLDNSSTVEVLVNGQHFQTFQLDAGTYDLANLPIQQGANDIQLRIRDSFGRERLVDYNFFYESLPLSAGEEEYSIGLGVLSRPLGFEQDYTDEIAASGYYRRGLSDSLVVGGALQASQDVQVLGASVAVVPQIIPGSFDIEFAASRSDRTGYAVRASYQLQSGNSFTNSSQLALTVDYETRGFRTIDLLLPTNFDLLSVGASYSQSFGPQLVGIIGASYVDTSARSQANYNVFADLGYRVSPRLRITLGGEYGSPIQDRSRYGVRAGVTLALGTRTRATGDYRSRIDTMRANFSRGAGSQIGSFGYDIGISRFGNETQADLQLEYISNRFTARGDVASTGSSLGGVFDDQRARLQIGTSLVLADGTFGIGRPISNSFLLAKTHPALEGSGIITARTLSGKEYYARSGSLGAAVQGDLSPYNKQNVQFDAANPEDGFDVGDGTVLVEPPYKSGYRLEIGDEYFVSIVGFAEDADGPLSLATGEVRSADGDEDFAPLSFFTNSAGRFGIFGLAPGRSYEVSIAGSGKRFPIEIPSDSKALLRLGRVVVTDQARQD